MRWATSRGHRDAYNFPMRRYPGLSALLLAVLLPSPIASAQHWVDTWAAAQQIPESANALPAARLRDSTIREVFHVSLGGSILRVRLSNVFGTEPLRFTSVHIARPIPSPAQPAPQPGAAPPIGPSIDPATDGAVTFSGNPGVTVPAGSEYLSDPIQFSLPALSDVAVSFHLDTPPAVETGHPGSRETTFIAHGDLTAAPDMPDAQQVDHWYQVSGIDVEAPPDAGAIVALGDSITDGHATTTNANNRWTMCLRSGCRPRRSQRI